MYEKKAPIPDVPTRAIILHYPHFSHTATTVRLLSIERKAQRRLDDPATAPYSCRRLSPTCTSLHTQVPPKERYASRTIRAS